MKTRVLVVPAGRFSHEKGTQLLDASALRRIVRAARSLGRDIPVDYGHETFMDAAAPAAGWLAAASLEEGPEGVYGRIEWTPKGREDVLSKRFRYLSPVFAFDPGRSGREGLYIERLVSLGLTNRPNIEAMEPLFNQIHKEKKMNEEMKKLKEALGLPPETADADAMKAVLSRLEEYASARKGLERIKSALGLPAASSVEEVLAAIGKGGTAPEARNALAANAEVTALKGEIASLRRKELENTVNRAITEGHILPAQKEWALGYASADPAGFGSFLSNSGKLYHMGEIIPSGKVARDDAPIGAGQKHLNGLLGISDEVFRKHNPSA